MSTTRPKQLRETRNETAAGIAEMAAARLQNENDSAEGPDPKRQKTLSGHSSNLPPVDASLADIRREFQNGGSSSSSSSNNNQTMTAVTGSGTGPSQPPTDAEGAFWFYYQDAYEDVSLRHGICRVLLFGKVLVAGRTTNCCLVVNNMKRDVYLLLKDQGLSETDHKEKAEAAFLEFREAQLKRAMRGGKSGDALSSVTHKAVKRKYVFEKEISHPYGELQFCKVTFDGSSSQIHDVGGNTYTDVFGSTTPILETLFKKRGIKGPMWLRVDLTNAATSAPGAGSVPVPVAHTALSHCQFEAHVYSHKSLFSQADLVRKEKTPLTKIPSVAPSLNAVCLSVKTRQKRKGGEHELVFLGLGCTKEPFSVDSPPSDISKCHMDFHRWGVLRDFPDAKVPAGFAQEPLPHMGKYELCTATSERDMLLEFLKRVAAVDPDVLVHHNAYGFGLDVLANRLAVHRIPGWDVMSRLRRSGEFQYRKTGASGFYLARQLTVGRLIVDTLLSARDLVGKLTNYELPSLMQHLFEQEVPDEPKLPPSYTGAENKQALTFWVQYTLDEMLCTFTIMHRLEILTLSKQLTILGGNLWAHSLQNKRAERNEYLLIHEFHREKYICPEKEAYGGKDKKKAGDHGLTLEEEFLLNNAAQQQEPKDGGAAGNEENNAQQPAAAGKSKGPQYSGGLVLEPKVGLYDDFVLLLDFNSLYPSLIQEYNICFSTVQRPRGDKVKQYPSEQELMRHVTPPVSRDERSEGILPRVLRRLVSSRKEVKKEIKQTPASDAQKLSQLDVKQKAIKLTANSMYGCLGFSNSRFHAKPIAALITQRGRAALSETQQLIEALNFDVVYGDTDSVFVRSFTKDYAQATQIAHKIKAEVNKKYRKLEIDLDGVFQRILLLKKKKYAGLKVESWDKQQFEKEYKGLDLVRRDWCKLSSEMGKEILDKILGGEFSEDGIVEWIHEYLKETRAKIDKDEIAIEQFLITKGISKMPHEYPDPRNQPHVMVAKRMLDRGLTVNPGLEVAYVICKRLDGDAGEGSAIKPEDASTMGMCAFRIEELKDEKNKIEIDKEWYVKTQLHPPLMRLLTPIPGTDSGKIAEALGLDGSRFQVSALGAGAAEDDAGFSNQLVEEITDPMIRYRGQKLSFEIPCAACGKTTPLQRYLGLNEEFKLISENMVMRCPSCDFSEPRRLFWVLLNSLRQLHHRHLDQFTQCTEPTCRRVSRTVALQSLGQRCENPHCHAVVREEISLQNMQDELNLMYVLLVRASKGLEQSGGGDPAALRALNRSRGFLEMLVANSSYNQIDLDDIFGKIYPQVSALGADEPMVFKTTG